MNQITCGLGIKPFDTKNVDPHLNTRIAIEGLRKLIATSVDPAIIYREI